MCFTRTLTCVGRGRNERCNPGENFTWGWFGRVQRALAWSPVLYSCTVYKGAREREKRDGVVCPSETEGGRDVRSQDAMHPEVSQAFLNRY